jgi:excisionase family DNA binding protein
MAPDMQPLLYDINAVCALVSLSRTMIYKEMQAGRLQWVKIGDKRLIRATDLQTWVDSLGPGYTDVDLRRIDRRRRMSFDGA